MKYTLSLVHTVIISDLVIVDLLYRVGLLLLHVSRSEPARHRQNIAVTFTCSPPTAGHDVTVVCLRLALKRLYQESDVYKMSYKH